MENKAVFTMLIIIAAALWGTMGVFTRPLASMGLGSVEIILARYAITIAAMFVIILICGRKYFKIELKDIWMFIGTGLCSMMVFNILYCMAQQELSLSLAAILLYTSPCFVMIFSVIFLKESLTRQKLIALMTAFAGCILCSGVIGAVSDFNLYGMMLGLGSGVSFSLYTVISKVALRKYHPYTIAFYTFLIAGICILPISDFGSLASVVQSNPDAVWYMLGLGLIVTVIPYFVYNIGLKGIDAGKASVISFVEPMVGTILGFVVYAECPTALSIFGIILIFVSLVLLSINFKRIRYDSIHGKKG